MSLVLLVEDAENVRRSHRLLLSSKGLRVVETKDKESALKAFRQYAGSLSCVITDLRLNEDTDVSDVSGAEVARYVKNHDDRIPTVCVSAYDVDKVLPDPMPFDRVYKKGMGKDEESFENGLDDIINDVHAFDETRFENAPRELDRIRRKYRISSADYLSLISTIPVSATIQTALLAIHELQDGGSVDEVNRVYTIEVVPADTKLNGGGIIKTDLPIVRKQDDGVFIAELYGVPSVYSFSEESWDDAKTGLLESLKEYALDLAESGESLLAPDSEAVLRFKRFLDEVVS